MERSDSWPLTFSNFVTSPARTYEKLEKQALKPFWYRPRTLLFRHSFSNSEVLGV
jgi:hypothetical protein